jgi:RNA recognition motif-containing protein
METMSCGKLNSIDDNLLYILENDIESKKEATSIVLLRKIQQNVTDDEIYRELSKFGEITGIQVITKKLYGYVEFKVTFIANMHP